jgi:hypothetical protein
MRAAICLTGLALALCTAATADQKSARTADPTAVEARFADGSVMKLNLLDKEVVVTTKYGKLTVPTAEIRRIEFGLRIPEAKAKQIEASIVDLGSPEAKARDSAAAGLLGLRELAFPALQRAAKSGETESARRARDILKTLQDAVPAERLALKSHDTVVTADFAIAGRVEGEVFKVRTPYFGEGQVRLDELRGLRWKGGDPENRLAVDAAKYAQQQESWMDTGVEVTRGTKLRLTASGTVDLWPIAPEVGRYLANPNGMQNGGGQFNAAAAGGAGMIVLGNAVPIQAAVPPPPVGGVPPTGGTLLGRIGETGKVFVVGKQFDGVATEEGKLYLRIVASPWGNASTGIYDVRVSTEER